MGANTLCIQMSVMKVFVFLLLLPGQRSTFQKPGFVIISPDRLQFFEYENVFINCGGEKNTNAWRVIRKLDKANPAKASEVCSTPAPSCTIDLTFERHSGEYWCENDEGERSHALNISVTAGSVILDFASRPVDEGSNVKLRCINKKNNQTQITDFFKNGLHHSTEVENVLTLENVSKSNEGFYKCSISGAGDSEESWLAVVTPEKGSNDVTQLEPSQTSVISILFRTLAFLLFLLIGITFFIKRKDFNTALKDETVTNLNEVTYAVVIKRRKRNGGNAENPSDQDTYTPYENRKNGQEVHTTLTLQLSPEDESIYAVVNI